jgi:hypothetical protein
VKWAWLGTPTHLYVVNTTLLTTVMTKEQHPNINAAKTFFKAECCSLSPAMVAAGLPPDDVILI